MNTHTENQNRLDKNTSKYIAMYLNPNGRLDKTLNERIQQIMNADVNWCVVAYHIQKMNYHNFLKTPYWKTIASYTKYKAGNRCQLCNSSEKLATHHRNYAIHGYEHANMQELTVLCDFCHNKFHNRRQTCNPRTVAPALLLPSSDNAQDILWIFAPLPVVLFLLFIFIGVNREDATYNPISDSIPMKPQIETSSTINESPREFSERGYENTYTRSKRFSR